MEASFNIKAIILNKQDFREGDSRIVCYSEDQGKMSLVVRGGKKLKSKLTGHCEPLTLARLMVIRGKDFDYVGTAQGENFFPAIKNDLEKITIALQALNLINKMTREGEADGQAEIFNLLKSFLEELEKSESSADAKALADEVEKELMEILGFSQEDFAELKGK